MCHSLLNKNLNHINGYTLFDVPESSYMVCILLPSKREGRKEKKPSFTTLKAKPNIHFWICASSNAGESRITLNTAMLELPPPNMLQDLGLTTVEHNTRFSLKPRVRYRDSSLKKREKECERKRFPCQKDRLVSHNCRPSGMTCAVWS